MTTESASVFEPINWLLVFSPTSSVWWLDRFVPGRFKHVMAAAWADKAEAWVIYEVTPTRTQILVMPDAEWDKFIGVRIADGASVLRIERSKGHWWVGRLIGSWCVPAVKRLIGLRSGALRPDRLFADCLLAGAQVVHESPKLSTLRAGDCRAEGG